jgi:hypothetical protein
VTQRKKEKKRKKSLKLWEKPYIPKQLTDDAILNKELKEKKQG